MSRDDHSILATLREALTDSERDYTTMPRVRAIILLAVPMILEMLMESVFAICDVFFVAKLGAAATATIGLTESLMTVLYAFAFGMAMSTTALVARRWGEREQEAAGRVGCQALALGGLVGVGLGLPGIIFADDLLRVMGADTAVVEVGTNYARIMMASNAIILALFLGNAVFRGVGDAGGAMRALWLANGINVLLDPCLIFGLGPFPEMGVTGAAVATFIGRGVGVAYQLTRLFRGPRLQLRWAWFRFDPQEMAGLVRVSWGGVAQQLVAMASWIALVRMVSVFGSVAVAGYSIAVRIIIFALLPSWGLANAAATLVGQNLGAGQPERAESSVWTIGVWNMLFLGAASVVFVTIPDPIVHLFTADPEISAVASDCLRIVGYGYPFYAWEMVLVQSFNGAGDTWTPTKINLACFWAFQLGFAWLLAFHFELGPSGVFWAVASGYSLAALVALVAFRRGQWKLTKV